MRPAKFHVDGQERMVINGPRPTPLRIINKDSHAIHKPSSMSALVATTTTTTTTTKQHHPIIIYAKSPKIIHAKPRDFMALVQRLTGLSSQPSDKEIAQSQPKNNTTIKVEDDESSSGLRDENCGGGGGVKCSSFSLSPSFNVLPNQFLADVPLFTPNSTNLFFSPRALYR